jgi:hypothetical protein
MFLMAQKFSHGHRDYPTELFLTISGQSEVIAAIAAMVLASFDPKIGHGTPAMGARLAVRDEFIRFSHERIIQ